MRAYQRLDVQLAVLFIVILSLTVSLSGWLHRGGHLIYIREPAGELQGRLEAALPGIRELPAMPAAGYRQRLQRYLHNIDAQPGDRDYLYLVVNEQFEIVADSAISNTLVELVRAEAAPGHFVVVTSNILGKIDFILTDVMLPGVGFRGPDGDPLWLLATAEPALPNPPRMQPILLDGLRNHLDIFGWYYAGVILVILLFIRHRLKPLRQLEVAAGQLIDNQLPAGVADPGRDDEVGQLVTAFNTAVARLAANEKQRKRMIADISHELRTPLTNISGRIEAYEDGIISDHQALIAFTSRQIQGLTAIVEDMSLLTLADAGELPLHKEPVSLSQLLTEMLDNASLGGAFDWQLSGDIPRVLIDPWRFRQVVNNLLSNAQKAKPRGLRLTVRLVDDGERVSCCFEDNGPGVSDDQLPHLFERLYRVDASRTGSTGGSGLGLSIVASLVHAHGGSIRAYGVRPNGLGLEIGLPVRETAD